MNLDESSPRFSVIFAPELYERLVWFVRLRWLAVAGLCALSLAGPRLFGLERAWPALLVIGLFVAGYNAVFRAVLGRQRVDLGRYGNLRACAIRQMVMDLSALLATLCFTGGVHSPLLPFFAIHMALGTIMIAPRIMYLLATGTAAGLLVLYALQRGGALVALGLPEERGGIGAGELQVGAVILTLFAMVYLTASITTPFKQRNIALHRATRRLRQRTEELGELLEQVRQVERRKSHYMRISAHQLRSPLGTIKTSLEVLAGGWVRPDSERGRRLLAGIAERVDGLLAIVTDLLELARIREGAARAPWTSDVNLNQLLADLFDSLAPAAEQRGVRMRPQFEGVAILERGVAPDLVFAFENLLANAIKYSPPGGEVVVRLAVVDGTVRVEVADRGIGVPGELREDIFLEFVRAPNARRHAPEGTGLGLAITREVVEAHGGRVWVEGRDDGPGSVFIVELPLRGTRRRQPGLVTVE
ncbi:MAG: hypothetical protein Kow0062_06510 [Acidobacteriota bacterium]